MNKNNKIYNGILAGIWYTAGNLIIKGLPFFTLPIFTRLLSPEDFGLYNTYLSYEAILGIVLGLGISGTIKTAKFEFEGNFDKYIISVYLLEFFFLTITLPVILSVYFLFVKDSWITLNLILLLIFHSLASAIISITSCFYVIEGRYKSNLTITFLNTFLNIIISIILCYTYYSEKRYLARIYGTAIAIIFIAALSIKKHFQINRHLKINMIHYKYALNMGIPLLPHLLSLTLLSSCDKIMIQKLIGSSQAGIYSVAVNIMTILTVFVTSIENAWAPWYYKNLSCSNYSYIFKKNNTLTIFFGYLTAGFLLISPELVHFFSEEKYWMSLNALYPLIISVFLSFGYLYFVNMEYFKKKTIYISYSTIICAITNIILNYFLINLWGYIGAAYATCLSKLLLLFIHYMKSKQLLKEEIASFNIIFSIAVFLTLLIVFMKFFEFSIFIRYSIGVMLTIILTCYLKKRNLRKEL